MYHFIINPTSSSGEGKKVWHKVKRILERENISHTVHFLHSPEEASQIAWDLSEPLEFAPKEHEINHLIVLGGDGTLNTILQGIRSFRRIRLSVIITGSGNDFARDMQINPNTEEALKSILYNPQETILDYGEFVATADAKTNDVMEDSFVNTHAYTSGNNNSIHRRFLISSGIGYDADICVEANNSKLKGILNKIGLGKLIYVTIGIKQVFSRACCKASITIESVDHEAPIQIRVPSLFFVVGMIHEYEGGGVPFCPDADPADGLLDVCLVEGMPKWKILLAVILVYMRKHYLFNRVRGFRARSLEVQLDRPQWFHTDGETSQKITHIKMSCNSGLRFVK